MKTKKTILVIISAITFFSCSEDENSNSDVDTSKIEGNWRLYKEVDYPIESDDDIYIVPNGCNEHILIFTGNTFTSNFDYDCNGSVDDTESGSYTINGTKIITEGYEYGVITTLNTTDLIIKVDEYDNETYSTLEFKRQ